MEMKPKVVEIYLQDARFTVVLSHLLTHNSLTTKLVCTVLIPA